LAGGGPKYALLTDITGTEDHYGDMDFKIAGTKKGITAMQLDVKLSDGVPSIILEEALDHARIGRLQILDAMTVAQKGARPTVKDTAPKAAVVVFDPERKIHLIGRGGEMLRFIEENYQCEVDIREDGVAYMDQMLVM
jgi:polyribonucleotide nucleotidyltransferase